MTQTGVVTRAGTALTALTGAVWAVLAALGVIHFTQQQTVGVVALSGLSITLGVAVIAHFWPSTASEPVAVSVAFIAEVNGVLLVGNLFAWWSLTAAQQSSVVAAVNAALALLGVIFVRRATVPAKAAEAAAQQAQQDQQLAVAHAQSIALRKPDAPLAPQEPMTPAGEAAPVEAPAKKGHKRDAHGRFA